MTVPVPREGGDLPRTTQLMRAGLGFEQALWFQSLYSSWPLNKHLMSTCCMPGTVLGADESIVTRPGEVVCCHRTGLPVGGHVVGVRRDMC